HPHPKLCGRRLAHNTAQDENELHRAHPVTQRDLNLAVNFRQYDILVFALGCCQNPNGSGYRDCQRWLKPGRPSPLQFFPTPHPISRPHLSVEQLGHTNPRLPQYHLDFLLQRLAKTALIYTLDRLSCTLLARVFLNANQPYEKISSCFTPRTHRVSPTCRILLRL